MAHLNEGPQFALCVAVGISYVIKPLLEFLKGAAPLSPLLDAAVAVVLAALPFAYLFSVVLLQLRVAPAQAPVPQPPAPARRFACHTCATVAALLVLLAVPVTALWLLAAAAWWPVTEQSRGTMDSLPRTTNVCI